MTANTSCDPQVRLEHLLATQDISQTLYLYAYGCDEPDRDALAACFHPDSRHRRGTFNGSSADYIDLIAKECATLAYSSHQVTNVMVKLLHDGSATSSSRFSCHQRRGTGKGATDRFVRGRWLDQWEKRSGQWRIVDRLGIHDLDITLPAPDDGALPDPRCTSRYGLFGERP